MNKKQPEALRLANILRGIDARSLFANEKLSAASAALENQHARITELEDACHTNIENYQFQRSKADRATAAVYQFHYAMKDAGWHPGRTDDDLTQIIRAKGSELASATRHITELEAQLAQRFDAADMATAAAQGFRDGAAKEQQAGWVSVDERLPEPDGPVLAHNGKWTGVAAWMSGEYLEPLERWQDEHREFIEMMGPAITHWMPLPAAPGPADGESK